MKIIRNYIIIPRLSLSIFFYYYLKQKLLHKNFSIYLLLFVVGEFAIVTIRFVGNCWIYKNLGKRIRNFQEPDFFKSQKFTSSNILNTSIKLFQSFSRLKSIAASIFVQNDLGSDNSDGYKVRTSKANNKAFNGSFKNFSLISNSLSFSFPY